MLFWAMKQTARRPLIVLSFLIAVGVVVWVARLRSELVIPGKTNALYSLETAWSKERVNEVLHYWEGKHDYVWKLNTIDLILPLAYGSFLILSILYLSAWFPKLFGRHARLLIALALIAAVCDVLEGVATYAWLKGQVNDWSPRMVTIGSILKFIISLPLICLVIGGHVFLFFRRSKRSIA